MKGDLKALLEGKLLPIELASLCKSYDIIGDIAVIRIPETLSSHNNIIAEALMQQHKHVKSVWRQASPVSGVFRLRDLEWIAGEKQTTTLHKEHGCLFKVDIKECYFSPRLAYERMRIANAVRNKEVIVNMFAGVGAYSIIIARHSTAAKIYSIDLNPVAVEHLRENILLNKMINRVIPMEGEASSIIHQKLQNVADRVLMPLPEKAYEYIESALSAINQQSGWIHYYDFEHARKHEDPIDKVKAKVSHTLQRRKIKFELAHNRVVRQTGPNWYQIAVDIHVTK